MSENYKIIEMKKKEDNQGRVITALVRMLIDGKAYYKIMKYKNNMMVYESPLDSRYEKVLKLYQSLTNEE